MFVIKRVNKNCSWRNARELNACVRRHTIWFIWDLTRVLAFIPFVCIFSFSLFYTRDKTQNKKEIVSSKNRQIWKSVTKVHDWAFPCGAINVTHKRKTTTIEIYLAFSAIIRDLRSHRPRDRENMENEMNK